MPVDNITYTGGRKASSDLDKIDSIGASSDVINLANFGIVQFRGIFAWQKTENCRFLRLTMPTRGNDSRGIANVELTSLVVGLYG